MKAFPFLVWSARSIGLCALSLTGCQLIFGDYKSDGPAISGAAGSGSTDVCETSGALRCSGATLEICANQRWVGEDQCPTAAQCRATQQECLSCAPGSFSCSGAQLRRCGGDGESLSNEQVCIKKERCNATTGRCDPCESNEAVCEGRYLKICNDTHTDWNIIDCENPNLCSALTRDCRPCTQGDYQCDGSALRRCSAAQEWETVEECASDTLCSLTITQRAEQGESWTEQCAQPGCAVAGQHRCDPTRPTQPQTCPASLEGWENAGPECFTADLCDSAMGGCKDGCKPGTYYCAGAKLQHCGTDGLTWITDRTCASEAECDALAKDCHECTPGERSCNGKQLRICKDRKWVNLDLCGSDALCQASLQADVCKEPGCAVAGMYQCSGAVLQACPDTLLGWEDKKTCASAGLCDAERQVCQTPVCSTPGELRCSGKVLEACDEQRATWTAVKTCSSTQICSVTQKTCLDGCPTPATQCNGKAIEECYVDDSQIPRWRTTTTQCVTAALCVNGACVTPACAANASRCTGQQLEVCNADRTAWVAEGVPCPAGTTCDSEYRQCNICEADTFRCDGSVLKRCEGSGSREIDYATGCVRCEVSTDRRNGSCFVCNTGDAQCSGANQIQSCTAAGAWGAAANCNDGTGQNYGCQKNTTTARKDYCAKCPVAGQLECNEAGTGLRQCTSTRNGWTTDCATCVSCPHGCLVNAGAPDQCDTLCKPNQTRCETIGTSATGRNTCAADGSGWLGITQKCADGDSLALCVNGSFSTTQSADCPENTPICAGNRCVQCNTTGPECASSNTESRTCSEGNWAVTQCSGICNPATGLCVECLPTQTATCPTTNSRRYCTDAFTWDTETCKCSGGACVECLSTDPPTCVTGGRRTCGTDNHWAIQECPCLDGACVECLATDPPTCVTEGRRTCGTDNQWDIEACPCVGGACVECLPTDPPTCVTGGRRTCGTGNTWSIEACPCFGGACVECLANTDCTTAEEPVCDTTLHQCIANTEPPDAGAGSAGTSGSAG